MQSNKKRFNGTEFEKVLNAEKMTPERLRTFSGFEEINEQEAKHVIETLESFCDIIVKHLSKKRSYEES